MSEKNKEFTGKTSFLGYLCTFVLFMALAFLYVSATKNETHKGLSEADSAQIIKVYDGDTLTALMLDENNKTQKVKIRLAGIDAPELKQKFGEAAKAHLAFSCLNQKAKIIIHDKDRYQRSLATVYCNDKNINKEMVAGGYAFAYVKYSKDYLADEALAKNDKRGIWAENNPLRPEEFRKAKKENLEDVKQDKENNETIHNIQKFIRLLNGSK